MWIGSQKTTRDDGNHSIEPSAATAAAISDGLLLTHCSVCSMSADSGSETEDTERDSLLPIEPFTDPFGYSASAASAILSSSSSATALSSSSSSAADRAIHLSFHIHFTARVCICITLLAVMVIACVVAAVVALRDSSARLAHSASSPH